MVEYVWTNNTSGNSNWTDQKNWNDGVSGYPDGTDDTATFNGTWTQSCYVDTPVSVGAITTTTGYTGAISFASGITCTSLTQSANNTLQGSGTITCSGSVSLSGVVDALVNIIMTGTGNLSLTPSSGNIGTLQINTAGTTTLATNGTVDTLTMTAGTLNISSYVLTLDADFSQNAGTVSIGDGGKLDCTNAYNFTVTTGGTFVTTTNTILICKDFKITGTGTFTCGTTNISISAYGDIEITSSGYTTDDETIQAFGTSKTINCSRTIGSLTISGGTRAQLTNNLTMTGNFICTKGYSYDCSNLTMRVGGNWNTVGGNWTCGTGTVIFTGNGEVQADDNFYTISVETLADVTQKSAITCRSLYIQDASGNEGSWDCNDSNLTVTNDCELYGNFLGGNATISIGSGITANVALNLQGGCVFNCESSTITIGSMYMNSGTAFTASSNSTTFDSYTSNYTITKESGTTFTHNSGIVYWTTSTSSKSWLGATTFNDIDTSGGSKIFAQSITIEGSSNLDSDVTFSAEATITGDVYTFPSRTYYIYAISDASTGSIESEGGTISIITDHLLSPNLTFYVSRSSRLYNRENKTQPYVDVNLISLPVTLPLKDSSASWVNRD